MGERRRRKAMGDGKSELISAVHAVRQSSVVDGSVGSRLAIRQKKRKKIGSVSHMIGVRVVGKEPSSLMVA